MKILICGGAGFVGKAIGAGLERSGHDVVYGVRHAHAANQLSMDFSRDVVMEDWLGCVGGMDVVINAVGILVERAGQSFASVHQDAPIALFRACAAAGVPRVIQISALGAESGDTPYFISKRAADDFLMQLPLNWQVVRPALIYGEHGASAVFFRTLSSLPIVPLPAGGPQLVQPVHIDDLVDAVVTLASPGTPARQCVELVGASRLSYREMLCAYRAGMGLERATMVSIPAFLITASARLLDHVPGAILTTDTWRMLRRGNTGDVTQTERILGRAPRGVRQFIAAADAPALRAQALASWRDPLLRVVLALVWIITAFVSALVYPVQDSLALLQAVGLSGSTATVALFAATFLDIVFGVATLVRPSRRLWQAQLITICVYSAIIVVALPQYLAHPFGPVLKNLPIMALLLILLSEEKRRVA